MAEALPHRISDIASTFILSGDRNWRDFPLALLIMKRARAHSEGVYIYV